MERSLSSLTPDLLDRILRFYDMSPSVLRLFLSGDSGIRRQLARGVTIIDLHGRQAETLNGFPKFIASLQALREISIHHNAFDKKEHAAIESTLISLPSSLTKLELNFVESVGFLRPSGRYLRDLFPNLETLALLGQFVPEVDIVACLPPMLRSLKLPFPSFFDSANYSTFSKLLPRTLTHLQVLSHQKEAPLDFWTHLPPNLTSLEGVWTELPQTYSISALVGALPRTLTDLNLNLAHAPLEQLLGLPPKLTSFGAYSREKMELLSTVFPSATKLSLGTLDAPTIASLPHTLTELVTTLNTTKVDPTQWPPRLTGLHTIIAGDIDILPDILPTGLLSFTSEITVLPMAIISRLPRTLTHLHMVAGELEEEIDFPPHLTSLTLNYEDTFYTDPWLRVKEQDPIETGGGVMMEFDILDLIRSDALHYSNVKVCFPYHKLPSNLRKLILPGLIPASKLRFLPHRLEVLAAVDIFEDAAFDRYSKVQSNAMLDKYDVGQEERIRESSDFYQLKQVETTALLPRTLKELSLIGNAMASRACWKMLPPNLQSLTLTPSNDVTVPAEAIFGFSALSQLRKIYIYMDGNVGAEHVEALPRSVTSVQLWAYDPLNSAHGKWIVP